MTGERPADPPDHSYEIRPADVTAPRRHSQIREPRPSGESHPHRPIRLLSVKGLLDLPRSTWLVDRIFRRGELVEIHGQPNGGKTFLALDIALSVAAGLEWCGRQVQQGSVIYIAAEGVSGLAARVQAWRGPIADPTVAPWRNLWILGEAVQFLEGGHTALLAAVSESDVKPALIVVDTLARCMTGGEENSSKDMGWFIERCDEIRRATGATVLLVHHSGKPHKNSLATERGSSALRGAVDTMIEVSLHRSRGGSTVVAKCEKQKEAEAFPALRFELETVALGEERDGNTLTSCRLIYKPDAPSGAERTDGLDAPDVQICRTLRDCFDNDGAPHGRLQKNSGVPESTFDRRLQRLVHDGFIESRGSNRSKRYFLSAKFSDPLHPSPSLTPIRAQGGEGTSHTSSPPPKGGESGGEGDRRNEVEMRSTTEERAAPLDPPPREGGLA